MSSSDELVSRIQAIYSEIDSALENNGIIKTTYSRLKVMVMVRDEFIRLGGALTADQMMYLILLQREIFRLQRKLASMN